MRDQNQSVSSVVLFNVNVVRRSAGGSTEMLSTTSSMGSMQTGQVFVCVCVHVVVYCTISKCYQL